MGDADHLHVLSDAELASYVRSLGARDTSPASNLAWHAAEAEVVARGREARRLVLLKQLEAVSNEAQAEHETAKLRRDKAMGQVAAEALMTKEKSRAEKLVAKPRNERQVEQHGESSFARRLTVVATAVGLITGPISAAQAVQALAAPAHETPIVLAPHTTVSRGAGGSGTMTLWDALECVLEGVPDERIAQLLQVSGHEVPPSAGREKLIGLVMSGLKS